MLWTGWSDWNCVPLSADLTPMGEGRTPGLHLSSIIHRMKVAVGENVGDIKGDQPLVRMQEGFLWESALEYVAAGLPMDQALEVAFKRYSVELRKGVCQQVKLEKDGVHMTPDAFNATTGEIESYKCTRRSLAKAKTQSEFEENFWPWLVQEKSYAYALGVDTVRWIVLWAAGDYSKGHGSGPRMLQSVGVFTMEELVSNWKTVLMHAEALREGGGHGENG